MYKKNKTRIIAVIAAVLILGILYLTDQREKLPEERVVLSDAAKNSSGTEDGETAPEESTQICVYMTGCVQHPGVYSVPEGTRIYEVLELSGGFTDDAERNAVNLAESVYDGEAIRIPSVSDTQIPGQESPVSDGRVNINTADLEELMTLPGIGKAKAEAVISYRQDHGRFTSVEGLMEVSGIGEGIFSRIRARIKV